jgi:hypothetical protein
VLRFLADGENAKTAAFAAALLCVWISVFVAGRVPRKTPRLFLALALFGLNWGLLLLYYLPGPPPNEILSAFSGFLLVYVGILLHREAGGRRENAVGTVSWLDKLPLYLFRGTVGGFGTYLVARRLLHVEYGFGTLALALWGTLLTVMGYFVIWAGLSGLYRSSPARQRVRRLLGLLLALYAACEVSFSVWYAREYWPSYHRYLMVSASPGAPDFEQPLPFRAQPSWPDYARWQALEARPDWSRMGPLLSVKVQPRLPDVPLWLEYAFALLKVLFTAAFLALIWHRPARGAMASETTAPEARARAA